MKTSILTLPEYIQKRISILISESIENKESLFDESFDIEIFAKDKALFDGFYIELKGVYSVQFEITLSFYDYSSELIVCSTNEDGQEFIFNQSILNLSSCQTN